MKIHTHTCSRSALHDDAQLRSQAAGLGRKAAADTPLRGAVTANPYAASADAVSPRSHTSPRSPAAHVSPRAATGHSSPRNAYTPAPAVGAQSRRNTTGRSPAARPAAAAARPAAAARRNTASSGEQGYVKGPSTPTGRFACPFPGCASRYDDAEDLQFHQNKRKHFAPAK